MYEVSALAYRGLARTGQDQTILVTGESGAGKTETVKIVMDHLATVQQTRPEGVNEEHGTSEEIISRVIKSSPVFEAFGNAKTIRNSNSSRFGKFIQLQFRVEPMAIAKLGARDVPYTDLVGSKVSTYLLEKNRVVFHAEGEQTFHIFYQLLAAPSEFKEKLWPFFGKSAVEDFMYTAGSASAGDGAAELWHETQAALGIFKFRNDSLIVLMQALGIVLQLGNLKFELDATVDHEHGSSISSEDELNRLSEMIGIAADDLRKTMTTRALKTPGKESITVNLTPEVAKEACDALAKEIYSKIFDLIVERINEFTMHKEIEGQGASPLGKISLLDIFGFEHFEVNRFEQLCINYTNEKLQFKFVVDNFNQIRDEYIEEGVDLFDFKLVDNSETLHLLESRNGLIKTLNEECMLPKGNDESFVYKVKKAHADSAKLISKKLHRGYEFGVNHFAGSVHYDARSFVQTNMDKLPDGLLECATKSTNSLIQYEFRKLLSIRDTDDQDIKTSNRKKKEANKTVMLKFQSQLKGLLAAMDGTRTRYIRCIKANAAMVPKLTEHPSTMKQLECSGLMTALIISRESYPQKLGYEFIMKRYACLMRDDKTRSAIADLELQEKVRYVLTKWLKPMSKKNRNGTRTMPFACGKTKVFFKPGAQDCLEHMRLQYYERSSRIIQTWFRRISAIRLRALLKTSLIKIQSCARLFLVKSRLEKQRRATTVISAWIRCRIARVEFDSKRNSAILIQCYYRRWKASTAFHKVRRSIILIQATIRMALLRIDLKRYHDAATVVSCWLRNRWYEIESRRVLAATKIQSAWRRYCDRRDSAVTVEAVVALQRFFRKWSVHSVYQESKETPETEKSDTNVPVSTATERDRLPVADVQTDSIHNVPRDVYIDNEKVEAIERLQLMAEKDRERAAELEDMHQVFKERITDLTKANDGLVKEVFRLRQESSKVKKQHRTTTLEMSSKISISEEQLDRIRRKYEKKLERMERKAVEHQMRYEEEKRAMNQEILRLEKKYSDNVGRLRDELRKTQESHQEYLAKLMNVLETTHATREKETAKISAELRAIKKEKVSQILMLQKEIKTLRAAKGIAPRDNKTIPIINAEQMKNEFLSDADEIANNSQQFNDTVESLTNLITATNALPPAVGPHNMKEVLEQQENAQRMMEMVESLIDLYTMGEERHTAKTERALAAVEDYIAVSEPDEAIKDLRKRLAKAELEKDILRQQLAEKEYCKRCAVRDDAARRRLER